MMVSDLVFIELTGYRGSKYRVRRDQIALVGGVSHSEFRSEIALVGSDREVLATETVDEVMAMIDASEPRA